MWTDVELCSQGNYDECECPSWALYLGHNMSLRSALPTSTHARHDLDTYIEGGPSGQYTDHSIALKEDLLANHSIACSSVFLLFSLYTCNGVTYLICIIEVCINCFNNCNFVIIN